MTTPKDVPRHMDRDYVDSRTHEEEDPPLTPDDIRRELGWHLIPGNGTVPEVPD